MDRIQSPQAEKWINKLNHIDGAKLFSKDLKLTLVIVDTKKQDKVTAEESIEAEKSKEPMIKDTKTLNTKDSGNNYLQMFQLTDTVDMYSGNKQKTVQDPTKGGQLQLDNNLSLQVDETF